MIRQISSTVHRSVLRIPVPRPDPPGGGNIRRRTSRHAVREYIYIYINDVFRVLIMFFNDVIGPQDKVRSRDDNTGNLM